MQCDFIAGCDGFHGVCRPSVPAGVLTEFNRVYPFAWLGLLAEVEPSSEELIYSRHERGFALHSMRSPDLTRLYLQVARDEEIGNWPDERIWDELQRRFATSRRLQAQARTDRAEGNNADAQLRGRADAVRQFVSGRRRGAYRAADRGQGTQSRDRRRARARAGVQRILCERLTHRARGLLGDLSAPRVESAAIFVVDDLDAASVRRRKRISTSAVSSPNSNT